MEIKGEEMSGYCKNCGQRLYCGVCQWCHEELYIEVTQGEFIESRSEEWIEKVEQQELEAQHNRIAHVRERKKKEVCGD